MKLEGAKVLFDQSWEESEILVDEMRQFYSQRVESAERLYETNTVLHLEKCEQLDVIAGAAQSRLSGMARTQSRSISKTSVQQMTPTKKQPIIKREFGTDGQVPGIRNIIDGQLPGVGQLVYLPKLGRDARRLLG